MKTFLLYLFFAAPVLVFAQVKSPSKWSYSAKSVGKGVYEVRLTATMEKGWHIYSQNTPDGGPVATSFSFTKNPLLSLTGKAKEIGKLEKHHEELFGVDVLQYSNKVDFVQLVKVKPGIKTKLGGSVEFMLCNDKECLPPATQNFSIALQ